MQPSKQPFTSSFLFSMATAITTLLLLASLPQSAAKFRDSADLFADSFHVESLTDASYSNMLANKTNEVWIVDFYAPWCPHCRVFAPELEKIAAFYAASPLVHVGAVDCTQYADACNAEDVMGYPTLKLFHVPHNATKGKKYNRFGMKTMQSIVKWVEDLLAEAQMPAGVQADNVDQQIELIRNDRVSDGLGLPNERSLSMKYARLQDAGAAAIFTLEKSLFIGTTVLEGERYSAALLWVQALGESFPLETNRAVFRELALAMEERTSWDPSAWQSLLDKWKVMARQTTFPKSLLVYDEETTWAHCNTYTCGLWTLFHSMTVTAGTPACKLKPSQLAAAIRFFVEYFFGCEECVTHFLAANPHKVITALADADADGNLKLVLWLWRMHNQVNKVTKKAFWPSVKSCPICFADNVRTPSLDPATLHEQAIVNYVTAIYEQSDDDIWTMNYENNGLGTALLDSAGGFSSVVVVVVLVMVVVAGVSRTKTMSFLKREHAA